METIVGSSKEQRRARVLRIYEDLLDYWTQRHRMIGSSPRINQTKEFIDEQADNARAKIALYSKYYLDGSKVN